MKWFPSTTIGTRTSTFRSDFPFRASSAEAAGYRRMRDRGISSCTKSSNSQPCSPDAYLERLNNPSPWTSRMMPSYRGMTRGFCSVSGSFGVGLGQAGLLIRLKPATGMESSLRSWLLEEALPGLPARRGLGSAHLFEGALTPRMTTEQRIRGADAGVDWVLFVTGYSDDAVAGLAQADLSRAKIENHGGTAITDGLYRLQYLVTHREVRA